MLTVDPDGGHHVAIDPYQQSSWKGAGLASLAAAGVDGRVEVIEEQSELALPQLVREGRKFDLAFVDGNHRFEGVLLDLVFMERLVKPGGLIVADDMWMPSARAAVAYVERNLDLELEPNAPAKCVLVAPGFQVAPQGTERNGSGGGHACSDRSASATLGPIRRLHLSTRVRATRSPMCPSWSASL